MPESGAWQPNTIGPHLARPRISYDQRELDLAVPAATELRPEVRGPEAAPLDQLLQGRDELAADGIPEVLRMPHHEVDRLELIAHEAVHPVELSLISVVGLEVPGHRFPLVVGRHRSP